MESYSGSAIVVQWITSSGTATLSGKQTNFAYTPTINLIDQTAGADPAKTYLASVKDGSANIDALFVPGTSSGGTVTFSTCTEGIGGTLQWQPEGTASTKPKYSMPAISQGCSFQYPYSDTVKVTTAFQQNGLRVEGTNT